MREREECRTFQAPGDAWGPGTVCRRISGNARCVYPCTSDDVCIAAASTSNVSGYCGLKDDQGGQNCGWRMALPIIDYCQQDADCGGHDVIGSGRYVCE